VTSSPLRHGEPYTRTEIEALFTDLPAVRTDEMLGTWSGRYVRVEAEQTPRLVSEGWYGMRFVDDDHVDTMLYRAGGGELFATDPAGIVAALAEGASDLVDLRSRIEVSEPVACMRMVEHRGTVSAAIIYKHHPIIDYLRRIDERTILGVAEVTGKETTGFFLLTET
jgi:hypothetical protein